MEAYEVFNTERQSLLETCEADHEQELKFE